ncbi:MAG: hypothetical protein IPM77_15195 [Crocinitomicaceae bacterium]|nr:hypothetical protein [Crocinitomicaceae bacterium]
MFERDVLLHIFWNKNDDVQTIHQRIVDRINCFLAMDKSELDRIKSEIWKNYEISIRVTDYGIVPHELYDKHNNSEEANREFFGHKNQEDTFAAAKINHIYFDDNLDLDHLYYMICFDISWDNEHGINMFCKDGKVESVE